MVYTECNPATCPSGDSCSNQGIQRHECAEGLKKFQTPDDRGLGVCASKSVEAGSMCNKYFNLTLTLHNLSSNLSNTFEFVH